jgi:ABC-type phosphate transport system substrate-binding protein
MKTRFFLMTTLICLLLVAWIWLEQQYEAARQEKYRQLSELPVYIYVTDSTRVAPLMERLAEFPQLRDINLETGLQAADELVQAYQLPISTAPW